MRHLNKNNELRRVSSNSKIMKTNINRQIKSLKDLTSKDTQNYHQNFTSLKNLSNLPCLQENKQFYTSYQTIAKQIIRPSQFDGRSTKCIKKNAIKFQSKLKLTKPNERSQRKNLRSRNQIQKDQDNYKQSRKITSLKSIKSVQNIQSQVSLSFKHKLQNLKNDLKLRQNQKQNFLPKLPSGVDNTSIVTQKKRQKIDKVTPIEKESKTLNQLQEDQTKKERREMNLARWQDSNIDMFEQKLQKLMMKASKNLRSRINLLKAKDYSVMHSSATILLQKP